MDFYSIVIIVALVLLIIALLIYGLAYKSINPINYPESQDSCPTLWKSNSSGYCTMPTTSECSCSSTLTTRQCNSQCNKVTTLPSNTPGISGTTFDPTNSGWATYSGAKNAICGKKKWATANNIQWNGISNYQC